MKNPTRTALLAFSFLAAAVADATAQAVPDFALGSRAAVRSAYYAYYAREGPAAGAGVSCTVSAPPSSAFRDYILRQVNYQRRLAGLPNVVADTNPSRLILTQSLAVLFAANNRTDPPYSTARYTICTSLLAAVPDAVDVSTFLLQQFPQFPGTFFRASGSTLGRAKFLFPPLAMITVGAAVASHSGAATAAAFRVMGAPLNGPRPPMPYGFAFPAAGYLPTPNLPAEWMYSYPGANFDAATVTMLEDGVPLSTTVGTRESAMVQPDNYIAWTRATAVQAGKRYTVTIAGIGNAPFTSITYTVLPFDPGVTIPGISADYDGNGSSDLVWQNTDGRVAVWTMNGIATTASQEILGTGTGWSVAAEADFDGDGKTDILWQHDDGRYAIFLMDGINPSSSTQILNAGSGWHVTHTADLNGDGKADLVWRHTDGSVAVWLMNGAAMTSGQGILGAGSGWYVRKTGDFDFDGKADLLWGNEDGRAAIWLMNGIAPTTMTQLLNAGSGWTALQVADLDGDGKSDIVWQHSDGTLAAWLMNGTSVASGASIFPSGTSWTISFAADFDGDGRADLLFSNPDGSAAIWLMKGLTATSTLQQRDPGSGWSPLRIADLNGDGKADIVWSHADGRISAWLMNGTTSTSTSELIGAGTGWSVIAHP
jgi:hypothetical protein